MSNFYTLIPGTDVLRSKIDVLTWTNPENENETERVELTVDNAGIFITSCSGGAREDMSIAQKDLAIALARAILEAYGVGWWGIEVSRFTENPDEIVLEDVKMFHLESMNERSLWVGVYTQDGKIYHLNISAVGDKLSYWWSDETCE